MSNIFTVEIDRKNLYAKKYDNKKCNGCSKSKVYIKYSLIEVFSKMINSKNEN